MAKFYQLADDDLFQQLKTTPSGLPSDNITALQKEHGANLLPDAQQKSRWSILLSQFMDVMIILLIIAAIISFAVGEHTDAFVILAIIIGNAWMGYSQEYNAEKSIKMLQEMSAQYAIVLRDDKPVKVDAKELVPGDIILLEAGDIVPADARLFEVNSFRTEEASLTGESHTVEKKTEAIPDENLVTGYKHNMVFKGRSEERR